MDVQLKNPFFGDPRIALFQRATGWCPTLVYGEVTFSPQLPDPVEQTLGILSTPMAIANAMQPTYYGMDVQVLLRELTRLRMSEPMNEQLVGETRLLNYHTNTSDDALIELAWLMRKYGIIGLRRVSAVMQQRDGEVTVKYIALGGKGLKGIRAICSRYDLRAAGIVVRGLASEPTNAIQINSNNGTNWSTVLNSQGTINTVVLSHTSAESLRMMLSGFEADGWLDFYEEGDVFLCPMD